MKRLFLPLLILLLTVVACDDPAPNTPQSQQEDVPETSSKQDDPIRQELLGRLQGYYDALEREQIQADRFFAPEVNSFFGKPLSRDKVEQSLTNGFVQVENRTMRIDPTTLTVEKLPNGGYVTEFSGQVSFIRTQSREEVHDVFHNRVTFNQDQLMTAYESLPTESTEEPASLRAVESDNPRQTAEAILTILQQGNLAALNQYLPSDGGLLMIRSGAYTFPSVFANATELAAQASWLEEGLSNISTRIQEGELPTFDCDDLFSKQGTYMDALTGTYQEVSSLMDDIQRADLEEYSPDRMSSVKSMESRATWQVIDTGEAMSICLGKVDGTWKLIVLDLASYDCSA